MVDLSGGRRKEKEFSLIKLGARILPVSHEDDHTRASDKLFLGFEKMLGFLRSRMLANIYLRKYIACNITLNQQHLSKNIN